MTDKAFNDWVRLFNMARDHASHELRLSNELLAAVDEINALIAEHKIPEERVIKITSGLMEAAMKLAEQSKQMSVSVYTLVGGQQ